MLEELFELYDPEDARFLISRLQFDTWEVIRDHPWKKFRRIFWGLIRISIQNRQYRIIPQLCLWAVIFSMAPIKFVAGLVDSLFAYSKMRPVTASSLEQLRAEREKIDSGSFPEYGGRSEKIEQLNSIADAFYARGYTSEALATVRIDSLLESSFSNLDAFFGIVMKWLLSNPRRDPEHTLAVAEDFIRLAAWYSQDWKYVSRLALSNNCLSSRYDWFNQQLARRDYIQFESKQAGEFSDSQEELSCVEELSRTYRKLSTTVIRNLPFDIQVNLAEILYPQAVELSEERGKISISQLICDFKIGYITAMQLLMLLCERGVIKDTCHNTESIQDQV